MRVTISSLSILVVLVLAASASAQSRETKTASVALFKEGRALMKADRYAEACAKFEASLALVPGVGTRLNLGECLERMGKTASAWAVYRDAELAAEERGDDVKLLEAKKRMAQLEGRLSHLTIALAAGAESPGLEVERDGAHIDRSLLGNAIPLDPGEHMVAARAPNCPPWQQRVTVLDGGSVTVEVPALDEAAPAPAPQPLPAPQPPSTPVPQRLASAPTPRSPHPGHGRRTIGLVVGGAGLAAVGVGVAYGLSAKSKRDDAHAGHCDDRSVCDPVGFALLEDGRSAATVSTVAFGVGLAAIATGVVLYVTAPAERPAILPMLSAQGVGLAVKGGF
jgi:hypothetical protein